MKIIIVGAGEVGRHLAVCLSQEAHSIAVIEESESLAGDLDAQIDALVLAGDGSSVNTLIEANVAECDLFLAVTSDNNTNLVSASIAKELGANKVICRVHPGLQREEWLFDHRGHFGIDYIFSTERLASVELSKHIRNPESLLVEELARGRVELQQLRVSEKSDAVGKTLLELELPQRVRIGSIERGTDHVVPTAEEALLAGDMVTIFGEPRKLNGAVGRLGKGIHSTAKLSVVIFGGGEYGLALAQMLESWNCKVRIFEQDPKLCEELTQTLEDTVVINADATSLSELREEQVDRVDFFVATSSSDEDNVMTCLQAHNLGAKHCLTLIHRADYADAISATGTHFGIKAAVSPREATRVDVMRFVTSDRYHVVKSLEGGEIIESSVPEGSKVAGKTVKEIEWPEGCVLVAHLHGIHATVPAADDVIREGDNIYAMVSSKARRKFLKLISK